MLICILDFRKFKFLTAVTMPKLRHKKENKRSKYMTKSASSPLSQIGSSVHEIRLVLIVLIPMYHSPAHKCPFLSQDPGPVINRPPACLGMPIFAHLQNFPYPRPHLIRGYLGPLELTCQTASWSVQTFCRIHPRYVQTHTDHVTTCVAIGRIYSMHTMRPKNHPSWRNTRKIIILFK